MTTHPDIEMLQTVADGLGPLKEEVVFVGGVTITLYIDDPGAPESMPTQDVDCVIEVATRLDYNAFEEKLRKRSFKQPEEDPVICRWEFCGISVDVMPTAENILNFSNRWYREGIHSPEARTLPNGTQIKILTLPYFLGTKFEAYLSRGGNDIRQSHDMEDIVLVLSGNNQAVKLIKDSTDPIKQYLRDEFLKLLNNPFFKEAVYGYLRAARESESRTEILLQKIREIVR